MAGLVSQNMPVELMEGQVVLVVTLVMVVLVG